MRASCQLAGQAMPVYNVDIGECKIKRRSRHVAHRIKRKQKCGGLTYGIKCRPCTNRKVKCSFEEEIKDPRHNPYLRLRASKSPPIRRGRSYSEQPEQDSANDSGLMTQLSSLNPSTCDAVPSSFLPGLVGGRASTGEELQKQVEVLRSR